MQNTKFFVILLVLTMLFGIFSLSPSISLLMDYVILGSTGRIATSVPITYKSEIRGIFVHCGTFAYPVDWNVIASTLKQYKINAVYGEFLGFGGGYYGDSPYGNQLGAAITALHAVGIKVHASMTFFYHSHHPELHAVDSSGNVYPAWICPVKQETRDIIKAQLEEVATNYDIDGFMFDYIRYDNIDMCYCSECKAKFEAWLGETIPDSNWPPSPSDFAPGGSRHGEFLEWRIVPLTELVRDVRNWMLAIKPDLEFSIAAWTLFQDSPTYWRYWIGQDTTDWVAKGYLDMVAPMMYTSNLADIQDYIQTDFEYMVGGPEGKVPLVAFISTGVSTQKTPAEFKAIVDKVREAGTDGWIIWRYGGPGVQSAGDLIDITPYLDLIDLPNVFSLHNIQVSAAGTETTITWTTDLPTISKVEYSTSPLFNSSFEYKASLDFHYWDIDHIAGTVIEDNTPATNHRTTLTGLLPETKYYFRVQSEGSGGILTSKVLTFTTK